MTAQPGLMVRGEATWAPLLLWLGVDLACFRMAYQEAALSSWFGYWLKHYLADVRDYAALGPP